MGLSREAVMPPAALPAAFCGFPLGWQNVKDTGLLPTPQMQGEKLGKYRGKIWQNDQFTQPCGYDSPITWSNPVKDIESEINPCKIAAEPSFPTWPFSSLWWSSPASLASRSPFQGRVTCLKVVDTSKSTLT